MDPEAKTGSVQPGLASNETPEPSSPAAAPISPRGREFRLVRYYREDATLQQVVRISATAGRRSVAQWLRGAWR